MFILDASVLLSPYSLAILRPVNHSHFGIAHTLRTAVETWVNMYEDLPECFNSLATYYAVQQQDRLWLYIWLREEIKEWAQHTVRWPKEKDHTTDEYEFCRRLQNRFQKYIPEDVQAHVIDLLIDQIWGAIRDSNPILAIGSTNSTPPIMWDTLKQTFGNQYKELEGKTVGFDLVSVSDYSKVLPKPIAEFQKLGIATTVLASLNWWLIDLLAPSLANVRNWNAETFFKRLRFVAFYFERP